MSGARRLEHYIGGEWRPSLASEYVVVSNPATSETLAHIPVAKGEDVDRAVQAAAEAYPAWRRTPPQDRVQYLFKLKTLLEEHLEELAGVCTSENGKTLAESRAELRRAIENVEVACGIPMLMQGYNLEDVASGIDETMIRQPVGVTAAITPFNFPAMIPFWFLPYAIACGNTFILKPSEKVPLTAQRVFEIMEQLHLPPGVLNLLHGGKAVVDALLAHPVVRAVSFVGSTVVAKYVYEQAAVHGKRVQCQGGAKNHVLVLDDADIEMTTRIIADSAFGCAGQRCLAVSVALVAEDVRTRFTEAISTAADSIRVGNGIDDGVQMGPVISKDSRSRIENLIAQGAKEGARVIVDGRSGHAETNGDGNFLKPTVMESLSGETFLSATEIFGPVLSLVPVTELDEGIQKLSRSAYGNMASIFTGSGAAARKFRYEVPAGNVGVNIGVAAPMAQFPFSGCKDSFFGDLHAQGRDAIDFYTEKKVVVERWPKAWSRRF
jgi:malonate-semialdehyde dehydrogenase (acetylating) / methylmalonate-semialdehyde dehydrogenase